MRYHRLLLAAALVVNATTLLAQSPPKLSGFRTPTGIRISSEDPANRFTLDINGANIVPISSARLEWRIDGRQIALSIERRPWELPESAGDAETLRAYRKTKGQGLAGPDSRLSTVSVEDFECESTRTCSLWSVVTNGQIAWTAAAVNGNNVILLTASPVPPQGDQAMRAWLKNAFLTLRRGDAVAARMTQPPTREGGMSLPEQIRLKNALVGKPNAAILNRKLVTENESRFPQAISVSSPAIVEIAKFLLRAEPEGKIVGISVFDGTLAHAINLAGFDAAKGLFKYSDPLGNTSFLAAGNNQAGIAAVQHPSEARMWLVPASDLERVFHSAVLEEWQILALLRLASLWASPEAVMIDTYRALKLANIDNPEVSDARFAKIGVYFLEKKEYEAALKIMRIRLAIYPAEAAAQKQALAAAFRVAGRSDLEQKLDAPFLPEKGASPVRQTVAAAMKTDFFGFFHLSQTAEEKRAEGGRILKFRPTGKKFHEVVEVTAVETPEGVVSEWTVQIARSMIADPSSFSFASDIAKSFLRFAVPAAGNEAVGRMAQEIWSTRASNRSELKFPGAALGVTVPSLPPLAYMTFVGAHGSYVASLEGGMLRIENVRVSDRASLEITVASQ